jgi:iron complex outermembrane recepter protein
MKGFYSVAAAAAAGALACSQFASAQKAASAGAENELAEVVVTAEKREETAQKTAISMSVYTAEDLQKAGVHDLTTLTTSDPSLNFVSSNGAAYIAMRGISSSDLTEIGDPAVSIARDGFFTNRGFTLFGSFYDIARVEVLKGPQGTLYGRNSAGGVVNIITNRPAKDFGGYLTLSGGNYHMLNLEGAINVPLNDRVQLRVSGTSRYHRGYRDMRSLAQLGDDEDSKSGRVQLAMQFTDNFSGLLSFQHDNISGVGDVSAQGPLCGSGDCLAPVLYEPPDPKHFDNTAPTSVRVSDNRLRWELKYDNLPGGLNITYLGGSDDAHWKHVLDATGLAGPLPMWFVQKENPLTRNHELRLASAADARLFWQIGAFYFHEDNNPLDSAAVGVVPGLPFFNDFLIDFLYQIKTESKAGFGQLAYTINDQWMVSAGLRYTKESKKRTGNATLNLVPFGGPVIVTDGSGKVDESKTTYHAGVDYQMTPDRLLYIKFDSGFKGGGFTGTCNGVVTYGPEVVDAVELGSKNRFRSNRIQANAAIFYQKYKGYQANQFNSGLCPGGANLIQNAGSAKIYGLESDITALADPVGKVSLNLTYLKTKFTEFNNAVDANGNIIPSLEGNELPGAPKFSATLALEHTWDTSFGGFIGKVDGKYEGSRFYDFFNYVDTKSPSTTSANVALTYAPAGGKWDVQAWVRNVTDEKIFRNFNRFAVVGLNNYEFAPPRTFGATLNIRF